MFGFSGRSWESSRCEVQNWGQIWYFSLGFHTFYYVSRRRSTGLGVDLVLRGQRANSWEEACRQYRTKNSSPGGGVCRGWDLMGLYMVAGGVQVGTVLGRSLSCRSGTTSRGCRGSCGKTFRRPCCRQRGRRCRLRILQVLTRCCRGQCMGKRLRVSHIR